MTTQTASEDTATVLLAATVEASPRLPSPAEGAAIPAAPSAPDHRLARIREVLIKNGCKHEDQCRILAFLGETR